MVKTKNYFFSGGLILHLALASTFAFSEQNLLSLARSDCSESGAKTGLYRSEISSEKRLERRASFLRDVLNRDFPVMIKKNGRGEDVPVVLINQENHQRAMSIFENSVGFIVEHKPDAPQRMDHGIMRLGKYVSDSNTPSIRSYGEIHRTGIAWSNVEDMISYGANYVRNKVKTSNPGIEVIFFPNEEELSTIKYYLLVRRAAIVRLRQSFDNQNVGKIGQNYLDSVSEHCFTYSKCQAVSSAVGQMSQRIQTLVGESAETYIAKPAVANWLKATQKRFNDMKIEIDTNVAEQTLYPEMVWKALQSEPESVRDAVVPKGLADEKKVELVNWLIGYDSFSKMTQYLSRNEISSSISYSDYSSTHAVGVLIYDYTDNAVTRFRDGSYTSSGSNTDAWTASGQQPATLKAP